MKEGNRLSGWWASITLKRKFGVFAGAVILTIGLAAAAGILTANFALYGIGRVLDDNSKCYGFQAAIAAEIDAFDTYVRNRSGENRLLYETACRQTRTALEELPSDYERIGAYRYARAWSIENAYDAYSETRNLVAAMTGREQSYIERLYEVYEIQEYLEEYARELVQLTLQEGDQIYLSRVYILRGLPLGVLIFGTVLIILIVYLTRVMSRSMIQPILDLAHASRRIAGNDFSGEDMAVENQDEMGELVLAFNKMKRATEGYITTLEEKQEMAELLHREEMERVELEKMLEATRLEALKSQINPHFLFNTLNTIACMAKLEDAGTTEKMITSMSNLFRYNLKTTESEVVLARELKIVEDYLYIQQTRFGDRLQYKKEIHVDENRVIIPSFSLQPIVENAVIHGISKKEQGGRIHIRVWEKNGRVIISVADSGQGMDPQRLEELKEGGRGKKTSRLGIGLGNIYKRLQMMYEGAELTIYSREGRGTVIQMKIPQRADNEETGEAKEYVSDSDRG